MEKEVTVTKQPKKRVSPIVLPTEDQVVYSSSKPATKAAATKSTTKPATKAAATKSTTKPATKVAATKSTTKSATKVAATKSATKPATKATTTKSTAKSTTKTTSKSKTAAKPKIDVNKITSVKIDPRTGTIKQKAEKKVKEEVKKEEVIDTKKKTPKPKVKKPSIKSKDVTIEPAPRDLTPKEIVRPTPKKPKQFNKDEKLLYKKLEESFNTVVNMGNVIEERTMDTKNIPDLTIGELHVIEAVNMNNNKPMTLIAKKMHVTVGSLTICVNRLVQKGYLLRTRDEMDHRVILLSITQQGKKVLKFHDKFHDDVLGILLDTIPLQQAVKVMSQLAYVLELYYDPSIEGQDEKKTNKKERK